MVYNFWEELENLFENKRMNLEINPKTAIFDNPNISEKLKLFNFIFILVSNYVLNSRLYDSKLNFNSLKEKLNYNISVEKTRLSNLGKSGIFYRYCNYN